MVPAWLDEYTRVEVRTTRFGFWGLGKESCGEGLKVVFGHGRPLDGLVWGNSGGGGLEGFGRRGCDINGSSTCILPLLVIIHT